MGNKTGHLPGDDKLEGRHRTRPVVGGPSKPAKKKVAKKPQSMEKLMGKGWRDRGVTKKAAPVTKRATVTPKKRAPSKRVIKPAPKPSPAQQRAKKEAAVRKKRAMNVLKRK